MESKAFLQYTLENFDENDINITWISTHPALTIEIIKQNRIINWNWSLVSCNNSITIENIIDNPKLPWDYEKISTNYSGTKYIFEKHYAVMGTFWKITYIECPEDLYFNNMKKLVRCTNPIDFFNSFYPISLR